MFIKMRIPQFIAFGMVTLSFLSCLNPLSGAKAPQVANLDSESYLVYLAALEFMEAQNSSPELHPILPKLLEPRADLQGIAKVHSSCFPNLPEALVSDLISKYSEAPYTNIFADSKRLSRPTAPDELVLPGRVQFSAIGFSRDGNRALLEVNYSSGVSISKNEALILARSPRGRPWFVIDQCLLEVN